MTLDIAEALRYIGAGGSPSEELRRDMAEIAEKLKRAVQPRWAWRVFPIRHGPEGIVLSGAGVTLTGESARRMLEQCGQAVLLVCTLGARFDAMLRAEQARDMAKAVMLDAAGSAWVEAGCGAAEEEIAARFPDLFRTDRFSPGYGDLPLEIQPALCAALDAQRRVGVCVTNSLLLNPGKSVTAIVGLADRPQPQRIRGCAFCSLRESCTLRKRGETCGS